MEEEKVGLAALEEKMKKQDAAASWTASGKDNQEDKGKNFF